MYFSRGYSYCSLQCKSCGADVATLKVMLSAQYKLSSSVRYPSVTALPGLSVRTEPALLGQQQTREGRHGALLIPSIVSPSSNSRTSQSRGCSWTYPPGTCLSSFLSFSSLCKSTCSTVVPFQPGSLPSAWCLRHAWSPKLAPIRAVSPRASLRTWSFLLWIHCLALGVTSFSASPRPRGFR